MPDGPGPVFADELVYRRVYVGSGFYNSTRSPSLSDKAFQPTPKDRDGISFSRANYLNYKPELAAAGGYEGKEYWIIELLAGDIQNLGIEFRPDPQPEDPGHTIIPEIRTETKDTQLVADLMNRMRQRPFRIYGPFPGHRPPP